MSDAVSLTDAERVAFSRLLWVGPLTIVAAVAANVAFVTVANPLFGVSPDFPPLTLDAIAVFTAVGVLAAVVVFGLVARFSKQPIRRYRQIALVALLLSLIPDLAMPFLPSPVPVGAREVVLLMATHLIAAAVAIWMLTVLTRESA
jgi:hypothetical protein